MAQKLITKEIEKALEKQGDTSNMDPDKIMAVAKFFNPCGGHTWYLYDWDRDTRGKEGECDGFPPRSENDPPNRLWAFVTDGNPAFAECGAVLLQELENTRVRFGLKIERDIHFKPMPLQQVIDKIKAGGHV